MYTLYLAAIAVCTILLAVPYSSEFEWCLHRFAMHTPLRWFMYPYIAHDKTHHGLFSGYNYHLKGSAHKNKIMMAWWNGPVIILIGVSPFIAIATYCYLNGFVYEAFTIALSASFVCTSYYGAYEYLHKCMHDPRGRWFETTKLFHRINGHHILHHRWKKTNFNVVLPMADRWHGTLLLRAPIRFAQVQGPSVPDLQPS